MKKRIDLVNDGRLLEEIMHILDFENDKEDVFVIPEKHLKALEESIYQLKRGDTVVNEEVDAKIRKWAET